MMERVYDIGNKYTKQWNLTIILFEERLALSLGFSYKFIVYSVELI